MQLIYKKVQLKILKLLFIIQWLEQVKHHLF